MKNKGFTLVEVLAVITIIGLLALITVPTVDSIIKRGKEDAFVVQKEAILSSLKNWAASKTLTLPTVNGETLTTTIGELKVSGFLEVETKNPMNDLCFSNDTILVVTRKNNNYTYAFQDENNIVFTEACEVG